ncbi:MAG: vitamin B12 dependent-methionine synthase activation domain-containing protein [Nitrososphaeria archaeon]
MLETVERNMKVIAEIPVQLDPNELIRSQRLGRIGTSEIETLLQKSRQLIEPKSVYEFMKVTYVARDGITLQGAYIVKSMILAEKVKREQTVVPYVTTIGPKLERYASEVSRTSMLQSFILEKIADVAVSKAREYVKNVVEEKLGVKLSTFGPGTGTGKLFDIKQQEVLFKMLNPYESIGVQLTPSFLMIPRKSVSGIFVAANEEYVACQYCPRKCEGRRKPFTGEYRVVSCEHKF